MTKKNDKSLNHCGHQKSDASIFRAAITVHKSRNKDDEDEIRFRLLLTSRCKHCGLHYQDSLSTKFEQQMYSFVTMLQPRLDIKIEGLEIFDFD